MRPREEVWRRVLDLRNRWYPGTPIYDSVPEGWQVLRASQTNPYGTVWVENGNFVELRRQGKRHVQALMWVEVR